MKFKRITALILSAVMVLGMIPFSYAFAEAPAEPTAEAQADPNAEPELISDKVVFVSGEGDDGNSGESEDAPVKTLTKAIQLLGNNGGTVVVCGDVAIENEPLSDYEYESETMPDGRFQAPSHTGLVYITASYGGTDYADAGAQITFGTWSDHGSTRSHHYILGGPTTFENIHFGAEANPVFYGRGHFITMGEGITSDYSLLVVGYDQGTKFTKGAVTSTDTDTHIIIKSGTYQTVSGMTRQTTDGAYVGTAYITVENTTLIENLVGLSVNATGGYYGNAVIKINGGTFNFIAGAAYNSTKGTYGDVSLTINTATVNNRVSGVSLNGSYNVFGDVTTVINGGTYKESVDGYSYGAKYSSFGNSNLTINDGSFVYIDGVTLGDIGAELKSQFGSATTTFNGGTVASSLCGGSYRNDYTAQDVTLNVNADTTFSCVVNGLNRTGDVTVNGDVTLNISNGTFTNYVCALSYGNDTVSTTVSGKPVVYCNISGGSLAKSGASLMMSYKLTVYAALSRIYYNVSGGSIDKIYVGSRFVAGDKKALSSGGMFFTYSGGSIKTICTAQLTGYQKYYFVGSKTYNASMFSCGPGGNSAWPAPGDNAFNYVNIGTEYPDAVYLSNEASGGDYVNDGLTPSTALQSVYDAAATLGPNGGTIYMLVDSIGFESPKLDGTLTFSGILPGETEPNGLGFNLNSSNLYLNSNVEFDGITFKSNNVNSLIAFQGHDVTINDNCTTSLSGNGAIGLIAGYSVEAKTRYNGGLSASQVSVSRDQNITVNGGQWVNFYGGNRRNGQNATVGTYSGDVVINIGAGATFSNNTPENDINPGNAVFLTGMNISKGSVTANLAGTFNTPVYAVSRLGVYFNGVNNVEYEDETKCYHLGTDGVAIYQDTKFEIDVVVNATGNFVRENGVLNAVCVPGDTPVHGTYTLNTVGATFASGFSADAKGILDTTVYTGDKSVAVNFDKVNGASTKSGDPIRVITLGDSITWGTCATNTTENGHTYNLYNYSYPMQLQKIFGENAVIGNYGYAGTLAGYARYNDYFGSSSYGMSLQFGDADAVIIAIGTNNHSYVASGEEEVNFYLDSMRRLIETYHETYPDAVIYITTALPRWGTTAAKENALNVVIPLQEQLAGEYSYTKKLDLYTAMKPYADIDEQNETTVYFADKLHPTNLGYSIMANAVYEGVKSDLHRYEYTHVYPTCTTSGYDEYACVLCTDSHRDNYVDPTGHDLYEYDRMEATTSSEGYIDYACNNCEFTTRETIPMQGKTYTRYEVIAPTCTEGGYTRHYCDQDDTYYDDTFIDPLGHDEILATVAPTCHVTGTNTITCSRCDYIKVDTIPTLEHVPGDDPTCTAAQKCTLCGDVVQEALGHDETLTVTAPTAHMAGYTYAECGRCGHTETRDWVDATDGIVIFVDTTNADSANEGTLENPFKLYTNALNYADRSFDRTIVLMSMVAINANYTENKHTGHYTVTSSYGGESYNGGFDVNGTSHYLFGGDVTIENLTIDIASTSVWRARYNRVVFGDGIVCTGKAASGFWVVGGDQTAANEKDNGKGTYLEFRSGTYFEIVGGHRSVTPQNAITGEINIYFGGTATTEKILIASRDTTGGAPIGGAVLKIDGGTITTCVGATISLANGLEANTPKCDITVYITENFVVENSFTYAVSGIFNGISLSNVRTANAATALTYMGTASVQADWRVYGELASSGKINEAGCDEFVSYGEVGDYDSDGSLTNSDVTLLVRYLAGWDVKTKMADITSDSKINNRDAILLIQKIAGWEE